MKFDISTFPEEPGVYFFLNKVGKILYIGKAINLKKRLQSHFRNDNPRFFKKIKNDSEDNRRIIPTVWDFKVKQMEDIERIVYNKERKKKTRILAETETVKFIITANDDEASTLEGCLISAIRPELNRAVWKYPFIEVTLGEEVPRVMTCYQSLLPDSYIFGPFNVASDIDLAVDGFLRIIPICNSLLEIAPGGRYPLSCVRHQVKRCLAPCKNKDYDKEEYQKMVDYFLTELHNNGVEIIKALEKEMQCEIERENFEGAAIYRDRIHAIERLFSARTMPTLIKKYYQEIKEIISEKYNYQGIIDRIIENNGK